MRYAFRGGAGAAFARVGGERDRRGPRQDRRPTRARPGQGSRPPARRRRRQAAAPAASPTDRLTAPAQAPARAGSRGSALAIVVAGLGLLAIVSLFFGMMMAISRRPAPAREPRSSTQRRRTPRSSTTEGSKIGTLLNNNQRILIESEDISPYMKQAVGRDRGRALLRAPRRRLPGHDARPRERLDARRRRPRAPRRSRSSSSRTRWRRRAAGPCFQKFRESALAYHLERQWDKDKILTEYLNTIYFGEGAYGIEAAARTYFGCNHPGCGEAGGDPCASELTPEEAAMLAGIITSPSRVLPTRQPGVRAGAPESRPPEDERAGLHRRRRSRGVGRRGTAGRFGHREARGGLARRRTSPPGSASRSSTSTAPARAFGGGLDVHTTIDLDMQEAARGDRLRHLRGIAPTASVVVLDNETGEIKAMVGGNDFDRSPFNLATNGPPPARFGVQAVHARGGAGERASRPASTIRPQQKELPVPGTQGEGGLRGPQLRGQLLRVLRVAVEATTYSDNSVFAELGLNIVKSPQRSLRHRSPRPPTGWASRPTSTTATRRTRRWFSADPRPGRHARSRWPTPSRRSPTTATG